MCHAIVLFTCDRGITSAKAAKAAKAAKERGFDALTASRAASLSDITT